MTWGVDRIWGPRRRKTLYLRNRPAFGEKNRSMIKKERKELVENSIALSISWFTSNMVVSTGTLTLNGKDQVLEAHYGVSGGVLTLEYANKDQSIEIQKIPAFRGYKKFFVCMCGKRCKMLYLRTDGDKFKCRTCNNLTYISNRVGRETVNGALFSDFNKLTRLIERREKIRSPWYRGEPTKNFLRLLCSAEKSGFHGFVREQWNGIKDIQEMKKVVEIAKNG